VTEVRNEAIRALGDTIRVQSDATGAVSEAIAMIGHADGVRCLCRVKRSIDIESTIGGLPRGGAN